MTRATDHVGMWRTLFREEHSELAHAAEMTLYQRGSQEQILTTALTELEDRPFHDGFGLVSALRAVVKSAIACNCQLLDPQIALTPPVSGNDGYDEAQSLETLPWAERAAYFLREVLHYSRRNTALLLGMSDANVDQLKRLAEKRMASPTNAADHPRMPQTNSAYAVESGSSMAFAACE